mmetsp:Transcript_8731/g.17485  ORF Transcript_8731/g.17485 Transcript_8731/m.17485 type:complete len:92 (+) Transcript_8731:29-304(+)
MLSVPGGRGDMLHKHGDLSEFDGCRSAVCTFDEMDNFLMSQHHQQSTNKIVCISYGILPSSRPMRTISGVLESSRAALSIRRIVGLVGALL